MAGRPSDYAAETAAAICARMAEGQSLREICRDEAMPGQRTVFQWLQKHSEFAQQYAKAREQLLEHWADEIVEIADDGSNDWIERQNRDGSTYEVVDQEHINRSRLRVDTRKWLMSKLGPKKYGERLMHAGDDNADPISVRKIVTGVPRKDDGVNAGDD